MKGFYTGAVLCGLLAVLAWLMTGGAPPVLAQSPQQMAEMCAELRAMEAELRTMEDPQMRRMLESQLAALRQQCSPGFAARQAAQTPPANPSTFGRYRLVAEQQLEVNLAPPGVNFHVVEVRHAQVEFEVGPNQSGIGGRGSLRYVSTNGTFAADGCQGRFTLTPVTHPAQVNARRNTDGNTVFVSIDDLQTGGRSSGMNWDMNCPGGYAGVDRMLPDDGIVIQRLPLRHGAQVTEVSPTGGIGRFTVKATLHKL